MAAAADSQRAAGLRRTGSSSTGSQQAEPPAGQHARLGAVSEALERKLLKIAAPSSAPPDARRRYRLTGAALASRCAAALRCA